MLKILAAFVVGFIATVSTVLFVASSLAINTDDIRDRKDATITAFWTLVTVGLCAVAFTMLTGCASIEGAGFTNTGRPRTTTECFRTDAKGHQVWFSVPAGQPCPR